MSMGRGSQRKGADGERELAAALRSYGYEIKRGGSLTFGEVPDLSGLPGVHIEVKRVERLNIAAAMEQAAKDAETAHDAAEKERIALDASIETYKKSFVVSLMLDERL